MLNIPDPWVFFAFILSIMSSVLCIFWGVTRWNEKEEPEEPAAEVEHWAREEDKLEEEL